MNYDQIDPVKYEEMYYKIPREIYMREHWRPLIESTLEKYCINKMVLDLGCGTGKYTLFTKSIAHKYLGLDISKSWLTYLMNEKHISDIIRADAHNIPLKKESFDVIISFGLFEYVDRHDVIKEIFRVLKPGGICVISVPNKYSAGRSVGKIISMFKSEKLYGKDPSRSDMLKLFKNNGLELVEYKENDGLIWLPDFLDKKFDKKFYYLIERFFKIFGRNPFSNIILFIAKKIS